MSLLTAVRKIARTRRAATIDRTVDELVAEGIVEVIERPGGERGFILTQRGRAEARALLNGEAV